MLHAVACINIVKFLTLLDILKQILYFKTNVLYFKINVQTINKM